MLNKTLKGTMKKIIALTIMLAMISGIATEFSVNKMIMAYALGTANSENSSSEGQIYVSYQTHMQTYGDQKEVSDGEVSGMANSGKRMEAIKIKINNPDYTGGVVYQTHVQKYGWMDTVKDGALSGTTGEAKRIEAIRINLYGKIKSKYDIYYRVYVEGYGWLDWAKNGASAGSAGQAKRLEALQVSLVEKGKGNYDTACSFIELGKTATGCTGLVNYSTHVQKYGDQKYVCDGSISGTSGEAKRLEAIHIKLGDTGYTGGVTYQTHVQSYGWQNWVKDDALSGTAGQAKRLEGIRIKLYGNVANYYDIYYRVHVESYGWLGWACNGEDAGTMGLAKRLEGIQIMLVKKGSYSQLIYSSTCWFASVNGNNVANLDYTSRILLVTNGHGRSNITKAMADSWQKNITVPTWDFESSTSMNKITKYRTITVNKYIASHVYNMFVEIYNSGDKPIIDGTVYSYSYRANVNNTSKLSVHALGCAIDINYEYNPNGVPGKTLAQWKAMPERTVAEKQAKAKTLYEGCTIVKIATKYGFDWGAMWNDSMHLDFID